MSTGTDVVDAKRHLRTRLLAARRALSADEITAARRAVRTHVLAHYDPRWIDVFAYEPLRTEPGSLELLADLSAHGARVYVPVLLAGGDLDWTPWSASGTTVHTLGVDAVRRASVVFVPALAVDRVGHRIGRGGGSYDRALARVDADVPVVALLHRGEIVDAVPTEPWDRPVTAAVSPAGWVTLPPVS